MSMQRVIEKFLCSVAAAKSLAPLMTCIDVTSEDVPFNSSSQGV